MRTWKNVMKEVKIGNQIWSVENLKIDDGKEGIYHHNGEVYYTHDAAVRVAKSVKGWHLPTKEEIKELLKNAGFETFTDKDGFNALPAGTRDYLGIFNNPGNNANYWSATEYDSYNAYSLYLDYDFKNAYVGYNLKTFARSVRLIKDEEA